MLRTVGGLAVRLVRRKVSSFADSVQNALADVCADVGAVIQHAVNRAARNTGAFRNCLYRGSFVHSYHYPFQWGNGSVLIIAQMCAM